MKSFRSILLILLSAAILLVTCSCGDVSDVKITESESQIYTEQEINSAVKTVKNYFRQNFSGCKLLTIGYAGDDSGEEAEEWAKTYESDKAIILISDFEVDSSGGDGSLEPSSTYTDWKWILVKDDNGLWRHATHGYG